MVAASSPSRSRIWTVASRMAPTVACARACRGCLRTALPERRVFIANEYRRFAALGPFAFGSDRASRAPLRVTHDSRGLYVFARRVRVLRAAVTQVLRLLVEQRRERARGGQRRERMGGARAC